MKIVTDCAADMPAEELRELGIGLAPLFIRFPEGEISSTDIGADEFYDRLEAMRPAVPTTSQPSIGAFADIYRQIAQTDRQILSIHISTGLSGTANSAALGGNEAKPEAEVTVWDSQTLSGGERFQVLAAAHAARLGWALDAIQQKLAAIREKTEVIYTLDTLEYLARGGRIGRVQALAGSLLSIKPIIRVDHADGKYSNLTRARTVTAALGTIVEHMRGLYGDTRLWVTVLHGRFADKADVLSRLLGEKLNVGKLEVMRISPVLGVHTGPGIVGLAAVPLDLFPGLM